jgi:hypothetical protein
MVEEIKGADPSLLEAKVIIYFSFIYTIIDIFLYAFLAGPYRNEWEIDCVTTLVVNNLNLP